MEKANNESSDVVYSCYHSLNRDGEHFVPQHALSFQIAGSMVFTDGINEYSATSGAFRLVRRNQLLKYTKQPPEQGSFESLNFHLSQDMLKEFANIHHLKAEAHSLAKPVIDLKITPVLQSYLQSLLEYQKLGALNEQSLIDLKLKECLQFVLLANPELTNILFDFSEPYKIDLEAFMVKNYHFNVRIDRFAYLTGRSLATFKRDFQKIFQTSPRQWLQERRLQEAHYLLAHKDQTASKVYLDLGFENLSHFSYSFKKLFGYPPSSISNSRIH
ncbi:AraC family transcriptional regulator [Marinilongibacter aquaticus]|uniref:helix-turn-helix domain-containing protein n=1 Tax=Marinilongibacter aquaticus TaxID=2975157 RepID=UPI0021BDD42E|nr:AraC family transcriptional regulator [Marinilongibacter aquaticus]UBM58653.1 AraC family transcriptional regulator [Marinilongibacter aquaticus]